MADMGEGNPTNSAATQAGFTVIFPKTSAQKTSEKDQRKVNKLLEVHKVIHMLTGVQLDESPEHLLLGIHLDEDLPVWKQEAIRTLLIMARLVIATHWKSPVAPTIPFRHAKLWEQYTMAKLTFNLHSLPSPMTTSTFKNVGLPF